MRTSVFLEFDGNVNYVYVIEICGSLGWELLESAFPTPGHAMVFYNPQITGNWEQTALGWIGALKKKSTYGKLGHTLRIRPLVMSTYEGSNDCLETIPG